MAGSRSKMLKCDSLLRNITRTDPFSEADTSAMITVAMKLHTTLSYGAMR